MKVIGLDLINDFTNQYPDAETWVSCWLGEVKEAKWNDPHDLKGRYPSASLLGNRRVVFDVKGNHYRMVCRVAYRTSVVRIEWIGTHAEYSKLKFK